MQHGKKWLNYSLAALTHQWMVMSASGGNSMTSDELGTHKDTANKWRFVHRYLRTEER